MLRDSAAGASYRRARWGSGSQARVRSARPAGTADAPAPLTGGRAAQRSLFPDGAAKHWILSSIIWLTVVDLFGLVLATEFVTPEAFGGISWLSFSRVRPAHVNGVILAWLTMMYFGALFYMLPRLVGTRGMWSERLGIICAWAWNLMYLLGIIGLLTGHSQGREYGEFIWPIDIALLVIWSANIVNILATVAIRTIRPIYVSVWFFIASPLWLAVDYAIGNVIWHPGHVWGAPSGALNQSLSDAMLNWWYAHNLFGLWLTPMLLALTYYIVPRVTNTPLYSYTLSLISFWGMAFFYTGVGDHHILQSPTPAWLKTIAEVSSWMLLVPVFAFTINILGTMKGNWDRFFTNLPLRFTMTAFFFYFLVNIQGAFEAIQPFNKLTHFTNFVVAHAHLALLGAFTILGMGVIDYIVAQIYAKPLWSRSLTRMAVLARDGRLHRLLQRADAGRLPAGLRLAGRDSRGQRAAAAARVLHRARDLRRDDRALRDRADRQHRDDDLHRHGRAPPP